MQESIESKDLLITTKQEKKALIKTLIKLRMDEGSVFSALPKDLLGYMSTIIQQLPELDLLDKLTDEFINICDNYQKDYTFFKNDRHDLAGEIIEILRLNNKNEDRKKGLIYFSAIVIKLFEYLPDNSKLYLKILSFLEKHYQCEYNQYWYYEASEEIDTICFLPESDGHVPLYQPINNILINSLLSHNSLCTQKISDYYQKKIFTESDRKYILDLMDKSYNAKYTTLAQDMDRLNAVIFLLAKPHLENLLEYHLAKTGEENINQSKIGNGI